MLTVMIPALCESYSRASMLVNLILRLCWCSWWESLVRGQVCCLLVLDRCIFGPRDFDTPSPGQKLARPAHVSMCSAAAGADGWPGSQATWAQVLTGTGTCAQVLSAEYGSRDWDSEEEDGFDPYWGVVDEGSFRETDVRGDAAFLLAQLAPLQGHHAPKCGLLRTLANLSGMPIESVTRPGT